MIASAPQSAVMGAGQNPAPAARPWTPPSTPERPSLVGSRPNIIYILADDLGYGDTGAYGSTKIHTPNIDRLAARGLLFTQHYAGNTVCAPSRASLLTGLDTGHTQIRGNAERGGFLDEHENGQMPLKGTSLTIARMMKNAGYATALVGKWGLGGPGTEGVPNNLGFDHFFGYLDQKQAHNYFPTHLWRDGQRYPLRNRAFTPHPQVYGGSTRAADYRNYLDTDYSPAVMLQDAKLFVQQHKAKPFFLYFAPTIPHSALQVPDQFLAEYRGKFPETPLNGGGYTPHPTPRAARAAMISYLDRLVGEIVAETERLGIADKTLIVFTSDNGPSEEGGQDVRFFDATGGLRGTKRDLYEGGIRVPMIAYWPGKVPAGQRTDHLSAFWDVMPTLAQLAGTPTPGQIDGVSFADTLAGREALDEHEYLYWEFHGKKPAPAQAIRRGDWKLIRLLPETGAATLELYNVRTDERETRNVAAANPDIVDALRALMDRARTISPYAGFNFDPSRMPAYRYEQQE